MSWIHNTEAKDSDPKHRSTEWRLCPPLDIPVDGGVVHLVDEDDEVLHAGRLHQHRVLSRLIHKHKMRTPARNSFATRVADPDPYPDPGGQKWPTK